MLNSQVVDGPLGSAARSQGEPHTDHLQKVGHPLAEATGESRPWTHPPDRPHHSPWAIADQPKSGATSRLRFSSKKPGVPATARTPSQSRPAASPLGAGVSTGPKKATPSTLMTGVPTS
jgi:hypothetical protein